MPDQPQPGRPFQVAAVNVNGLTEATKRRTLFTWAQEQHHGIVLLSETHCTSDSQAQQWVQEGAGLGKPWQGASFWCHQLQQGQRAAGGVGILLSDSIVSPEAHPTVEHQGPSGRVLKVSWMTPWGQHMAAVAVYAPCSAEDRSSFFLDEYMSAVNSGTQQRQIVGGDFNCVMRPEDVLPAPQQQQTASARLVGGRSLHTINLIAGLQDSWLLKHPDKLQPTHYTQHAVSHEGEDGQSQLGGMSGGRLDYVFLSDDLVEEGWLQSAHQHRRFPSDHRPVVVKLQPPNTPQPGPKRWRFPNHLLGLESFHDQLQHKLEEAAADLQRLNPRLDPAAEWEQLKCQAQQITKQLQKEMAEERQAAKRTLQQAVAAARHMHTHYPDQQSLSDLLAAEQSLTAFETAQLQHRVEASEPLWEVYGESSTFWFHRLGKTAPEPQFIAEVLKPDGTTVAAKGQQGVRAAGELLADFYDPAKGGLFSKHPTDPQQQQELLSSIDKVLDEEDQQQCRGEAEDGSISMQEARAALNSLPRGKAPGSDGLTYEFYTAMWDVVGPRMVAAFNYAFQQPVPSLSAEQRLGLILLIYKGGGKLRADPASYRPITLLNCDLKIIAKVIVLRFGPALDSIIDDTQTAFVPGRDIADNVLLHLEEIDYLEEVARTTGQQGCIVFLDFEKAYDRLNRDWLFKCMQAMQFPDSSIRWVRLLLRGTCGQVLFNGGHTSRVFDIPSGCAQGSPLSPLLYVIAAQPLAARCRQLQADGSVRGIRMPDGTAAPSSQQHADDTSLHAETAGDVRVLLQRAVAPYCAASAAKLNSSKCKGMVLGAHPAMAGPDAATGVVFVDTRTTPIKHLGVLLSVRGASAFADQLYEQRLQSIGFRARQWARHDLSLLGRCEVARQVLASCLVYHTQFVPVPDHLMTLLQRRITAFVLGMGCIRNSDQRTLQQEPAAAVASLPQQLGGIGQVDIAAHTMAMQAKVAAALLHPHRRVWKPFMRANLERALPGLGEKVLLMQHAGPAVAALRRKLNPRHAAYVAAFQALGLHRQIPHEQMSAQQVGLELMVGNHSIADAVTGGMFTSPSALPARISNRSVGLTLGQVSSTLSFQPAVDGLVLPPSWQQKLQAGQQDSCPWQLAPGQDMVLHEEEGRRDWYSVMADGSLSYLQEPPTQQQGAALVPCCVVYATKGGPRRERQQEQQQGQQGQQEAMFYLVGPWSDVRVDPSVWCFGASLEILRYTVKGATRRLIQLSCKQLPGWVSGHGIRPRLWRGRDGHLSPDTALPDLEQSQKRKFADLLQQGFRASSAGRFSAEVVAEGVHANWMDPSPPRLHPRQRAAAAATAAGAQVTAQRHQQLLLHITAPAVDDTVDPLSRAVQEATDGDSQWHAAYRHACDKSLPRQLRVFGWRMLHAAVKVGGSRVYMAASRQQLLQCCCPQLQCQPQQQQQQQQQPLQEQGQGANQQQAAPGEGQQAQPAQPAQPLPDSYQLESLSHMFVQCPIARQVWQWFARIWHRVQPAAQVDFSSTRIVLLDDGSVWQPPAELQQLWTYMRLLMLESIWSVRCRSNGKPYASRQVISRFLAALQQQLKHDWARTQGDIRINSGVPLSWLKGRNPVMPQHKFAARWQGSGGLWVLGGEGSPRLCFGVDEA